MKATEILIEEHQVISRVLDTMENAVESAAQGLPVRPEFFIDSAAFIKGFADGCHHRKEENVLFKAITDSGVPVQGGPVGVMLSEHEQGRAFTRGMRAADSGVGVPHTVVTIISCMTSPPQTCTWAKAPAC